MREKKKKTNKPDQRRGPLHQRRGRTQRKKKNKKQIRNRKREKIKTGVGGFEVSAWDHGWVGWLQIKVGHAMARAQLRPGLHANLGLARTWVALWPGSRAVVWWSGSGVVWLDRVVASLVLQRILKSFEVLVFSGGLNCWCFISLKTTLINRVSNTRFPCGHHM